MWINRNTHKKNHSLNLIRNHVSIMAAVRVIIISLITNIKIAIIIIALTKNDYHNDNNSNNNNNNNNDNNSKVLIIVLIFKIIATASTIIIIIIIIIVITTDSYSKLTRSSYRYCFPHCSFFDKNTF